MLGLAVLAAALISLAVRTHQELRWFHTATAAGEQGRPAPPLDPASPTGYVGGRRSQILQSTDGYHWVMQTQRMIATGDWRVRHVDYDNAPAGREVHWCTPLHLWLAFVAWGEHVVTGRSWVTAVESAALYAGPLLLALILIGGLPWLTRRFGAGGAAVLAAGFVWIAPLTGEFGAGSFDHHGVAAACAVGSVLLLVAGWREPARAHRDFLAAGVIGALGLWVNAATQIPVLAGIGVGALLATRVMRGTAGGPDPACWRTWGLAGAAVSLAGYLLEYFPSHLGWRLEVNHPLHALAWAAAGDWLARLAGRSAGRPWFASARDRVVAVAGGLALILPAVLALVAPGRTFVVRDPFLWTLHVDYISEFSPLFAHWNGLEALLVRVSVLPLAGLGALWLAWPGRLPTAARAVLVLTLPPAILLTLLAWSQQRWLHVSCALWLAVVVTIYAAAKMGGLPWTLPQRVLAGVFLAAVFLPYPARFAVDAMRGATGLSRENVRQFAVRDLAFWLQRRADAPVVVLSGPTATTEMIYHGGFRGVGTLYWENLAGLRTLVDIYGATDPARARELLRAHGVTHLVLFSWGPFAEESARLAQGRRASEPAPIDAFARELLDASHPLPAWLRPMPYRLPESDSFKDQFALIMEVVSDQSPADAAVAQARFLTAIGNARAARQVVEQALATDPNHLNALVELARLQRAARDRAGHAATMRRALAQLRSDPAMTAGDRIALALELTAAGAREAGRAELVRCWAGLDATNLPKLWPESLAVLLRLTDDLAVEAPAALWASAESLSTADRAAVGQK